MILPWGMVTAFSVGTWPCTYMVGRKDGTMTKSPEDSGARGKWSWGQIGGRSSMVGLQGLEGTVENAHTHSKASIF